MSGHRSVHCQSSVAPITSLLLLAAVVGGAAAASKCGALLINSRHDRSRLTAPALYDADLNIYRLFADACLKHWKCREFICAHINLIRGWWLGTRWTAQPTPATRSSFCTFLTL